MPTPIDSQGHTKPCRLFAMTNEIWTILGVGIALASLIVSGRRGFKSDINALATRASKRLKMGRLA